MDISLEEIVEAGRQVVADGPITSYYTDGVADLISALFNEHAEGHETLQLIKMAIGGS